MRTTAPDPLFDGLIAMADLPRRLNMSRQGIYLLAKRDAAFPPRVRIGRRVFVSEHAVRRWIMSRVDGEAAA